MRILRFLTILMQICMALLALLALLPSIVPIVPFVPSLFFDVSFPKFVYIPNYPILKISLTKKRVKVK